MKLIPKKDSGEWKRVGQKPPDDFICDGCGCLVHRPNREWEDPVDKCLNCWFGPEEEETTT
jgi:hypothetical protein